MISTNFESLDNISNLPDELLLNIFSLIPEDAEKALVLSKRFHVFAVGFLEEIQWKQRLHNLRSQCTKSGLSIDRWKVHMIASETRLESKNEAVNSKNIHRELMAFQMERLSFAELFDTHDYIKNEKEIKSWHSDLFKEIYTSFPVYGARMLVNESSMVMKCKKFTEIPEKINLFGQSLLILDLTINKISYISSGCFSRLTKLYDIDLSWNQFTVIDTKTFSGLQGIRFLNISWNQIKLISKGAFSELSTLKKLYLSDNQITEIGDETFSGLSSLEKLSLSDNQITAISRKAFSGLTCLKYLNLRNNKFKEIAKETFSVLTDLEELKLDDDVILS